MAAVDPSAVLTALADLASVDTKRDLDVTRGGGQLVWLTQPEAAPRNRAVDRLAALDALHREERLLRRGVGFVVGVTVVDGTPRKVRAPLLTEPVRLERQRRGYRVVSAGDLDVSPLVTDAATAARLASAPGLGTAGWLSAVGTTAWLRAAAEAAGLPVTDVHTDAAALPTEGLAVLARAGLYLERDGVTGGLRDALLSWAARPGLAGTALATIYSSGSGGAQRATAEPVSSPLPLSAAQREVVARTRVEPLVVVSGPPGCGKSHALVAAAIDVVDRGGSVLVATQSMPAAQVLAGLLERYPGPVPVIFGDAERRAVLATRLGGGLPEGWDAATLRADQEAVQRAEEKVAVLTESISATLTQQAQAAELDDWQPLLPALQGDAPGLFEPGADLERAADLATRAAPVDGAGWWRRLRARLARRRLAGLVGADPGLPRVATALDAARSVRAAATLASHPGTDLAPSWAALRAADEELARVLAEAFRHRAGSAQRWNRPARQGAATLATALRSGRQRRRELLAGMAGPELTRALPLWVGTVTDVEDLLPPTPGLFDLVILDEAAHVDQVRAAPVLARAKRALVAGDPRQLRFVSFVADVDVAGTLRAYGLDERVDVRRVSAYDLATAAAPVTWLDEHHRGVPHLIGFSARRFYDDRVSLATRHPRTDQADVIDVLPVAGTLADGVVEAEVAAVLDVVKGLAAQGRTGIGVVSPFRAQADALESALLAAYPVAEIERLGLRVGTVHAFQGSEAPVVVAALGLVPGDAPGRRRFVADPNLFNVLVTRARERMVLVTSVTVEVGGLIGEYLRYSSDPLALVGAGEPAVPQSWAARLAGELARAGAVVRPGYPVGRWSVDICLGEGEAAVGLVCAVHPDGVAAHLERQRDLMRAGWTLLDAFPNRWGGVPKTAALALLG